jgi:transcriptional regulator with XRE-family HTH domain
MKEIPIAERIRELRLKENLTQRQLAASLKVSANTVAKYEGGGYYPSLCTVVKLAKEFGVSTDYLLGVKEHA